MTAINGKIFIVLISIFTLTNCNKIENKMKNKLIQERPYEDAKIDKFYWVASGWDYTTIPLIKPYNLQKLQGSDIWTLGTNRKEQKIDIVHGENIVLNIFSPVEYFNIKDIYIYGEQDITETFDKNTLPKIWFIINMKERDFVFFEKEEDFKSELKKLNLPEEYLNPETVYEQYKQDPILPWFPEDVKKQLEEVKAKK